MVISGKTYKETDKDTVAINVLLIKFHPFKRQAARNNGIFSNVFVSHKGISNRLLNMIATPGYSAGNKVHRIIKVFIATH